MFASISIVKVKDKIVFAVEFVTSRKCSRFSPFWGWMLDRCFLQQTQVSEVFYLSFCQLFISTVSICFIPGCSMFCLFLRLWDMICQLDSEKQIAAGQGISLFLLFPYLPSHGFDPISMFQSFSDVWHYFDFLKFGQFYVHRGVCNKVLINQVPLVGCLLKLEHTILRLES